jgi:hypothetical protein
MTVSIALLQPAQGRSHGGGGARSFSPAYHYSGSAGRFSGYSRGYPSGGAYYNRAYPRYYQGAIGNRPYVGANGQRAIGNRAYPVANGQRAFNRGAAINSRVNSPSAARFTSAQRATLRSQGIDTQGRVSSQVTSSWDRGSDHNWHGHRCHFHNNSWVIIDPWFYWGYPWSYGYYGYGYGYPYDPYYYGNGYYGDGYYDNQYAPSGYSEYGNGESTVGQVQSALSRKGYYHGAVDGRMGPATRSALRQYQVNHGLEVTGQIDRSVTSALRL